MTCHQPISPQRRGLRLVRRPSATIRPSAPRPQRRDCQSRLVAGLLEQAGAGAVLIDATFRPWCSATFIGAQHRILLRLGAETSLDAAQALAARLPEVDLPLPGHVVVDLAVDDVREDDMPGVLLDLAVLTVEDW